MTKTSTGVDLEPIDRLEEKIRLLVATIDRMRAEQARATEDNLRLSREADGLRARIAETESLSNQMSSLQQERELVRARVAEMLDQLEALNL
jgi:regulator of replication initiation timing